MQRNGSFLRAKQFRNITMKHCLLVTRWLKCDGPYIKKKLKCYKRTNGVWCICRGLLMNDWLRSWLRYFSVYGVVNLWSFFDVFLLVLFWRGKYGFYASVNSFKILLRRTCIPLRGIKNNFFMSLKPKRAFAVQDTLADADFSWFCSSERRHCRNRVSVANFETN